MFNQVLWFIETNDFDDALTSINIDTPFDEPEGDSHKQLELFVKEEPVLDDVGF